MTNNQSLKDYCSYCNEKVDSDTAIKVYNEQNPHTYKTFCNNRHYRAWVKQKQIQINQIKKLVVLLNLEKILKFRCVYRRRERIINGLRIR